MKKHFLCVLLLLLLLAPTNSSAVPAYPDIINHKNPDGSSLSIRLYGDEFFHWAETVDGYTILMNDAGYYEYGIINSQGDLVSSWIKANDAFQRTAAEENFLKSIPKKMKYSSDQMSILKQIKDIYALEKQKAFPTTGTRKLICILIGYTDLAFTKTQTDFNNLFNQVGYTADSASGSVKDYYLENSWNQFTLNVTVAGPYTASNTMAYYGANDANGYDLRPRELVTEAVNLADPDVNYADFDNDNDGSVDSVYVIYAGYGEEAGAPANAIWAHAWSISPVTIDGKSISRYSCSSELRSNSGTGISRIGVICHEFGHVLGAPDYYDTNYSTGGQYQGNAHWDLMSSGSWNNDGATPAHHNGYTKWHYYNWFTASELTSTQAVTVQKIVTTKSAYWYQTPTANEFWFLENRQQTGFDTHLPGHGLIIYHVDQDGIDSAGNAINATHPQLMYPVCASASGNPTSTSSSYGVIDSTGCPFPGSASATQFTSATMPSAIDWLGQPSGWEVKNINESSGIITFNFGTNPNPTNFAATPASQSQIDLSWNLNAGSNNVLVAWSATGTFGTPVDGNIYSAGNAIPGGGTVLYYGTNTSYNHTSLTTATTYYYKAWSNTGAAYSSGIETDATTSCTSIASFPYSIDFETGVMPNCWTQDYGAATYGWQVGTDGGSFFWPIPSHTNYAYVNDDACDCDMSDVWLISPPMDFSSLRSASLTFDSFNKVGNAEVYTIKASINGGSSWIDIASMPERAAWTSETVDLSSLVGNSNVMIAFHYNDSGGWMYGWAIDNVVIDGPSSSLGFLPAIYQILFAN